MNPKRFWLIAAIAALCSGFTARAQTEDPPVGVAVKIQAKAIWADTEATLGMSGTFLADTPGSTGVYTEKVGSTTSGEEVKIALGSKGYVRVEPEKTYTLTLWSSGVIYFDANIIAPPGYRVQMDHLYRGRMEFWDTTAATLVFKVTSLGSRHAGLGGMASSISTLDIDWRVSLGNLLNGSSAGDLALVDTGAASDWAAVAQGASLFYEETSSEVTVFREANMLRQIVANQVVLDIPKFSTYFEIRCYHPSQKVFFWANQPYGFTGQPFVTYRVEKGSTATSLKITKSVIDVQDATTTNLPVSRREILTLARSGTWPNVTWTKTDWTLENQTAVSQVEVVSSGTTNSRSEAITIKVPGGSTATSLTRSYSVPLDGNNQSLIGEVVSGETVGSGSQPLPVSFAYYTDGTQWGSLGYLKTATLPGGNWVSYEYHEGDPSASQPAGRIKTRFKPYLNAPGNATQTPSLGEVTSYTYVNDVFGAATRPSVIETKINGTVVAKSTFAYADNTAHGTQVTKTEYITSGSSLQTITNHYPENYSQSFLRGQPVRVSMPNGVQQVYAYGGGYWNGTAFVGSGYNLPIAKRLSVITGSSQSTAGPGINNLDSGFPMTYLVDGKSTWEATIRDYRGLVVRTENSVWKNNGWVLTAWTNYSYDFGGRLTQRVASNGITYTATYSGGLKTSETDEAGVTTNFTYDAGGRVLTSTRVGVGVIPTVVTKYTYDAASRATRTDVGYGQSEVITSQTQYDDAGRVVLETPPGNYGVVTHTYDVANRTHTTTNAEGGTVIATTNLDGTAASTTGTATVASYHTYGVETDGRQWHQVNTGSASSARWQKSWSDWLGRTTESKAPGFTGQPDVVTANFYETGTGRLTKTTKTGYAPTLYEYNALGQVSRSGLDYDSSNTLVLASNDRITESETYIERYDNAWWARSDARTYPKAGANTAILTASTRTRLTNFPTNRISEVRSTDAEGNITTQVVDVNRAAATSTATTTRSGLTGSTVETTVNGFSVSVTDPNGLTASKGYDSLLRSHTVTDSRGNTTTNAFITGTGLVQSVTNAHSDVAVTSYDTLGRVSWQRDPKNFYTRYAYNARGQVTRQWGDGTMPVEYGYEDTYGEKVTMTTYRGGTGWDGTSWPSNPGTADTITWNYDAPSGLLKEKVYPAADPSSPDAALNQPKIVSQTYNNRGQTAVRTLARGVTTTYGYDNATGELLTQTYSDSTPTVTYTYGRAGQVETISDVTGLRDLIYDPIRPWRLSAEAESSFYDNRVVTRTYEETAIIGRVNGFQIGSTAGSNADLQQTFGFTTTGRFSTVSSVNPQPSTGSHTFRYGYLSNANLLQSVSLDNSGFTITRSYEAQRDLITTIHGQWSAASRSRYDYTYDERGYRSSAKQSGDAFADYGDSTFRLYGYNGKGEVTSDYGYLGSNTADQSKPLPGRHYGFGYDNAGNRKWSDRTGVDLNSDGLPDLRDNYTTNALNQYTARENNTVPASGTAATDTGGAGGTAVNVKGRTVPAGRQGKYWNDEMTVPNTLQPWRGPVTIFTATRGTGGSPDLYRTDSRMVEIGQVLQSFTYDNDGNLLSDGITDYTWDAENRLVRMETTASARGYGFPHRLLEFKYDYMGRRVEKRVVDVDQSTELSRRRFLYDGWNLVAEYSVNAQLTLLRSYTWGLDIVNTLSDAGGVGALLQIADHPTGKTYLPTYDGNGNIVSLLNASSGVLAAVYEYSPYGEPLRAQTYDATIADNPWRFSTKWTDLETGLVYYGMRYYSSSQGRFLGRDTVEESGGLNLYGFCFNNTINLWDLLGMIVTSDANIFANHVFGRSLPIPTNQTNLFMGYDTSWISYNSMTRAYNVTKNTQSFGDPRTGYTIYKGVQIPNIVWNGSAAQRNTVRTSVDNWLNNLAQIANNTPVTPRPPTLTPAPTPTPTRPFEWSVSALMALGADVVSQTAIGWANIGFMTGLDPQGYRYQQAGAFIVRQSIGNATGIDVNDPAFQLQSLGWQFVFNAGILKGVSRIGQYADNFIGPVPADIHFARNLRNATTAELNDMIRGEQTDLLRHLFGDGIDGARAALANTSIPQGLNRNTLHVYSEIASRQINGGFDTNGAQAARLLVIEKALAEWGLAGPQ